MPTNSDRAAEIERAREWLLKTYPRFYSVPGSMLQDDAPMLADYYLFRTSAPESSAPSPDTSGHENG